ncbi:FMN-binding protein [Clostridium lundense]|uniref:FMN-binding protein n=1 Tax=Clostridium lundense TaxID=319475 RepID=UPI00048839A9|nr:FMN-binding protein [Clostridium lundense]
MVKIKSFLKIIVSIVIVVALIFTGGIIFLTRGLKAGSEVVINNVNVSSLNDGVYSGEYKGGRWTNSVNVSIKNHKITKIDIVKDVLFKKDDVREKLFNRVIEKQNVEVDAISSATVTSKAYLKSIENALKK